jgi:hypothetical protein
MQLDKNANGLKAYLVRKGKNDVICGIYLPKLGVN